MLVCMDGTKIGKEKRFYTETYFLANPFTSLTRVGYYTLREHSPNPIPLDWLSVTRSRLKEGREMDWDGGRVDPESPTTPVKEGRPSSSGPGTRTRVTSNDGPLCVYWHNRRSQFGSCCPDGTYC